MKNRFLSYAAPNEYAASVLLEMSLEVHIIKEIHPGVLWTSRLTRWTGEQGASSLTFSIESTLLLIAASGQL